MNIDVRPGRQSGLPMPPASPRPGTLLLILYVYFPRKPPLTIMSLCRHGCRGRLTELGQGGHGTMGMRGLILSLCKEEA